MPNVVFPSQAHGMTNKGRGPAVPPVGVSQFTSMQCHNPEANAVIWQKNNDDRTVLLILQCLSFYHSSFKDKRASDDSFPKGKALSE